MTQYLMCEWKKISIGFDSHHCLIIFCRELIFFLNLMVDLGSSDSLDEGVELGYRLNNNEWIPLAWYSSQTNHDDWIKIGMLMDNNLMVRGFTVPFYHGNTHNVTLKLCGSDIIEDGVSLSFRWLHTVNSTVRPSVDDIAIDDVQIGINSSTLQLVLLMDNFDNQMSIKWVILIKYLSSYQLVTYNHLFQLQ